MKLLMRKKLSLLLVFIILGFILRFYRLADWFYFTMDEERDAFAVKRIIVDHKPTLIGGSVPGGFYVGPGLYYLSALPLLVSNLNPIGLGLVASLLGVFSIWLIFKTGKELFNPNVGLIASGLFSSSYLMVIYNRHYWPLTPAPVVGLVTIYCLYQIIKEKKYQYSYLLAIVLAIGLNSDPTNLTCLLLTLIAWCLYRLPVKKKETIISGLILIFSQLPLLLFDLRHNWLNTRALIKLFTFKGPSESNISLIDLAKILRLFPNTFARLIYVFGNHDISQQLSICNKHYYLRETQIPLILLFFSSLILIYFLIKGFKTKKRQKRLIALPLISFQLMITFSGIILFNLLYPGHLNEYFLSVLFPSFFLLMALTIEKIFPQNKKGLKFVFVFLLIFFNSLVVLRASNSLGLTNKMKAVAFSLSNVKDRPFYLESLSSCFRFNGSRYLFYLEGDEPEQSFMDVHYTWLYDQPPAEKKPDLGVIFVSHDQGEEEEFWQQYSQYQGRASNRKRFGDLEVLIIDNHVQEE